MMENAKKLLLRANGTLHVYSALAPVLITLLFRDEMQPLLKQYQVGRLSWTAYLTQLLTTKPMLGLSLAWVLFLIGSVFLDLYCLRQKQPIAKIMLCLLPLAPILLAASIWLFLLYLPVMPA